MQKLRHSPGNEKAKRYDNIILLDRLYLYLLDIINGPIENELDLNLSVALTSLKSLNIIM